jgi:hypothetical protein
MSLTIEQKRFIDKLLQTNDLKKEFDKKIEETSKLVDRFSTSVNIYNNKVASLERLENEINILIKEKNKSFPWLSKAIADLIALKDNTVAKYLTSKKRPAIVAAEKLKDVAQAKRILVEQLQYAKYTVDLYESLFPFLCEFREDGIEDALLQILESHHQEKDKEEADDPVKVYLTPGEYLTLSPSERNQKALDRYTDPKRKKSSFQIGKEYERYVGYIYETKGYDVTYFGIEEGKEDLGRDLVCKKNDATEIIQCKYWSSFKTIHEKHINQLFGTTIKYYIDTIGGTQQRQLSFFPELLKQGKISASFYTSTELSNTARKFAQALGITVYENHSLKSYPVIKCHINKQSGEKIYHLPFDQMYDRTKLEKKYDEFYAMTVKEAEEKGFRRAWKWRGN